MADDNLPQSDDLSQDEMREILTEIARKATNAAARIAAIKELRALDGADSDAPESDEPSPQEGRASELAKLDELAPRRYRAK